MALIGKLNKGTNVLTATRVNANDTLVALKTSSTNGQFTMTHLFARMLGIGEGSRVALTELIQELPVTETKNVPITYPVPALTREGYEEGIVIGVVAGVNSNVDSLEAEFAAKNKRPRDGQALKDWNVACAEFIKDTLAGKGESISEGFGSILASNGSTLNFANKASYTLLGGNSDEALVYEPVAIYGIAEYPDYAEAITADYEAKDDLQAVVKVANRDEISKDSIWDNAESIEEAKAGNVILVLKFVGTEAKAERSPATTTTTSGVKSSGKKVAFANTEAIDEI